MNNNYYNKELKEYARTLRTTSVSKAEKFIWKALLSRQQTGYRFKRQRPIDKFIVDFFCPSLGLVIEIDGSSHLMKGDYDAKRQSRLESLGYTILRVAEGEVLNHFEAVESKVRWAIYSLNLEKSEN